MRSKTPAGQSTFIQTARRAMIIAAAVDCLAHEGYVNTSLSEIAKRAGIAKSAVSYYFEGKEALVQAVLVELFGHVGQFMQSRMNSRDTIRGKLQAYIEANLVYVETHPDSMTALFEILHVMPVAPNDDATLAPLEALLREGQRTGEFRDFDPRPMAVTIRRAIDGALAEWKAQRITDLEAYAHELVTLFDLATQQMPDVPAQPSSKRRATVGRRREPPP